MNCCPNCGEFFLDVHEENACILGTLIDILRENGSHTEPELANLMAGIDLECFWYDMSVLVDRLGSGFYTEVREYH